MVLEAPKGEVLLHVAQENGVPVGSNCGGVCGCSTCHVYLSKGFDSLEDMEDREADRLDLAFDVRLNSRLACQVKVADEDLVVDVTEESLKAFLDENPEQRKRYQEKGEIVIEPYGHHH